MPLPQLSQLFPPKPTWNVSDIPSLAGKQVLVTGGNTGIGKQTCKQLLLHGAARVFLCARSESKAKEAIADLEKETEGKRSGELVFVKLDLADLASCKSAALDIREKLKENGSNGRLDVLFANAGIMTPPKDQITAQSFDMQFGTNVLGHFLFIHHLIPSLQISSPTSPSTPSRIIWTASSASLLFTPPVKYDTLKDGPKRRKKSAWGLYTQSKYGAVLVARALARRYGAGLGSVEKGEGEEVGKVVTVTVDPGNIQSDLQRNTNSVLKAVWDATILFPTEYGCISQLHAGTVLDGEKYNDQYIVPWARIGKPHKGTNDVAQQEEMWKYCEEACGDYL